MMSEADVIREAIGTDLGEYEIQEPLAALDSLTTRLAEVEQQLDEWRSRATTAEYHLAMKHPWTMTDDEGAALRTKVAEVERERDALRIELDSIAVPATLNRLLADRDALRSQLTRAREALERIANERGVIGCSDAGYKAALHDARQALVTINEGETG